MAFDFEYSGGVAKPHPHSTEKFMLFFVVDGREVPMYQLQRDSLVQKVAAKGTQYLTGLVVGKLFCGYQGFGIPRQYHSFYFRFVDGPGEMVTVSPFTVVDHGPNSTDMYFRGKIRFLNRLQVLEMLQPDADSRPFVERQSPLPLDMLQKMIQVEKTELKDIRFVRIGKQKRGSLDGLPKDENL